MNKVAEFTAYFWIMKMPDLEETKYYAPGIGLIVELGDGERVELVEFSAAP